MVPTRDGEGIPQSEVAQASTGDHTTHKTKEDLEREKLQVELDELRSKGRWRPLTTSLALGAALVSLLTGMCSLRTTVDENSRKYHVGVDQQVIQLVSKLETDSLGGTVVLLLAAYGQDAVAPLIWNLRSAKRPAVTIETLRLLKDKQEVSPNDVLFPLFRATRETITRELEQSSERKNLKAITNYLTAVGELGGDRKAMALALIKDMQKLVAASASDLPLDDQVSIEEALTAASRLLEGTPPSSTRDVGQVPQIRGSEV